MSAWAHAAFFCTTCLGKIRHPGRSSNRRQAAIDKGRTLIGMHLRDVAVPVRLP